MKQIDLLEKKCVENGITLNAAVLHARVPATTIFNWRKKEPQAFETKRKIESAILELSKIKSDNATEN